MKKLLMRKLLLGSLVMLALLTGGMFYSVNQSNSDELYVRIAAVYEGKIDERFWMTKTAIDTGADTFINDMLLTEHDQGSLAAAVGFITSAGMRYDDRLKVHYLEVIAKVTDPLTIYKIKKQLYSKVSIGFHLKVVVCSECGKDMKTCGHIPGEPIEQGSSAKAHGIVISISGMELSFVNIPASEHARVLKWSHSPLELSVIPSK